MTPSHETADKTPPRGMPNRSIHAPWTPTNFAAPLAAPAAAPEAQTRPSRRGRRLRKWVCIVLAVLAAVVLGHYVFANLVGNWHPSSNSQSSITRYSPHALIGVDSEIERIALDELARLPGSEGVVIKWDEHPLLQDGIAGVVLTSGLGVEPATVIHLSSRVEHPSGDVEGWLRYVVRHEYAHILQSRVIKARMGGGWLPVRFTRWQTQRELIGLLGDGYGSGMERAADYYAVWIEGSGDTDAPFGHFTKDEGDGFPADVDHEALVAWFEDAAGK